MYILTKKSNENITYTYKRDFLTENHKNIIFVDV